MNYNDLYNQIMDIQIWWYDRIVALSSFLGSTFIYKTKEQLLEAVDDLTQIQFADLTDVNDIHSFELFSKVANSLGDRLPSDSEKDSTSYDGDDDEDENDDTTHEENDENDNDFFEK